MFSSHIRSKIRLGEHEIKNELIATKDCEERWRGHPKCNKVPQDFEIEDVLIHPGYKGISNFFQHDIALIRLKGKAKVNGE